MTLPTCLNTRSGSRFICDLSADLIPMGLVASPDVHENDLGNEISADDGTLQLHRYL
jgi:hypothetical protein